MTERHTRGVLDTSTVILLPQIADASVLANPDDFREIDGLEVVAVVTAVAGA